MDSDIGEVCNKIVRHLSQNGKQEAKDYCREKIDYDIDPKSDRYQEIKSEAIDETEVWGNESQKWLKIVPAAASKKETDSEWRFVVGNLFISAVMECETTGSLADDALITKAAHEMFKQLHKSKRHEMLSLALHHHKIGHVSVVQEDDYQTAIDHFEKSVEIIEQHESLGGWHHNALILRDLTRTKADYLESQEDLLEAVQKIEENSEQINEMNAPTSEKFYKQLKAEEHRLRSEMAEEIDNKKRQRKHLRKCSKLYEQSGKDDLAEKYGRKEMRVGESD